MPKGGQTMTNFVRWIIEALILILVSLLLIVLGVVVKDMGIVLLALLLLLMGLFIGYVVLDREEKRGNMM